MNILFWGLTVSVLGKVLLAAAVVLAHMEMAKERSIDDKVISYFRREYVITFVGIALIVIGYLLEIYFYSNTHLLTCVGAECAIE